MIPILIKYWRYFALIAALVAVFAWHKSECSRAAEEAVALERTNVALKTEELRREMQAKIDAAEQKEAKIITRVETKIETVNRDVIRTEFLPCPASFAERKLRINEYIRASNSGSED